MTLPAVVNLLDLARTLESEGREPRLIKLLESAWRVQSCLADLRQAHDCTELLFDLRNDGSLRQPYKVTLERSLMVTAVILYARATSTSSKRGNIAERGSTQLNLSSLTNEQVCDHQALIDLRNEAFAHVRSNHQLGDLTWHSHFLYARQEAPGAWLPASASRQIGSSGSIARQLRRAIPIASAILYEKFQARLSKVTDMLNEAGVSEEDFFQHALDPIQLFGGEEQARAALNGGIGESVSFWSSSPTNEVAAQSSGQNGEDPR